MLHFAAILLGLHSLPKYPFRGFQYTKVLTSNLYCVGNLRGHMDWSLFSFYLNPSKIVIIEKNVVLSQLWDQNSERN